MFDEIVFFFIKYLRFRFFATDCKLAIRIRRIETIDQRKLKIGEVKIS